MNTFTVWDKKKKKKEKKEEAICSYTKKTVT